MMEIAKVIKNKVRKYPKENKCVVLGDDSFTTININNIIDVKEDNVMSYNYISNSFVTINVI